jgi:tetratricopeptide (TPR) repeat protein
MSPLGNGRDWKDPDLSQVHGGNVSQVSFRCFPSITLDLFLVSFSHLFWVDASSEESMEMSLRGISSLPAARNSGVNDSVDSVLQWISYLQEEWLIVFDNADVPPPEVVEKFIPSGNRGNILITSRNRSMGRIVSFENRIEIKEMEERDAITLLLKAGCLDSSPEHLEVSKKIVTELGCIPLAIDHAGAYIEAGKCDIDQYLRLFSVHRQALMSDVTFTGASKYNRTVYGTWDLSFKEIEKRAGGYSTPEGAQAAQAAILILQICAFYHHTNISKDIFQSAAEKAIEQDFNSDRFRKLPQAVTLLDHTLLDLDNDGNWDEFIFGQGISVLLSFSLMKRDQSSETFSVHPLVHYWSRERMSKSDQQKMCVMGSTILSCAISWGDEIWDYKLRRFIFPHIKANKSYERQIGLIKQYYDDEWEKFALVLGENGDSNNAEQLEIQVMDMRKKTLGAEHPDTIRSMGNLACTYSDQGRWDEAEQLRIQVMDMRKKLLGAEHPDTIWSMGNLANTYSNQGRWNEAEQLQIQVMNMRKKLLGAEHPDTISSIGNLASTYRIQGRWNEAEQLQIQVMDMRKKLLGAEHPDTIWTIGNLATTYRNQGRWNEAEQLQIQVMDMRKKLLGAEHPDTIWSIGDLALTYWKQGRWNVAEQLQIQVMDMRKKLLGAEHPDTISSMGNIACIYSDQGRWDEAEQLQIQVMDMRKKLLGAEHPDTIWSIGNLANTYSNQGRWNEAEQLQIQVMDMRKKLLGPEHPDTIGSIGNLANTYSNQGRLDEAEQLQIQVMDMRKKLLGAEHPDTISSMGNLANTFWNQGRWNEAEQLEIQVMDMRKKLLGAEHPDTIRSMEILAWTYRDQGRYCETVKLELEVMNLKCDGKKLN